MSSFSKLKLTYFNFAGRAEPLRLACAIGKVPFTNVAVEFKDWAKMKPTTPHGTLPYLQVASDHNDDDKEATTTVSQSLAIFRYLGKQGGLYPTTDDVKAMQIDGIIEFLEDAGRLIAPTVMGPERFCISDKPWSTEETLAIRKRITENEQNGLPFFLGRMETTLKEQDTGYLVGDKITIADLAYYRLLDWISSGSLDGIPTSLVDKYPLSKALMSTIEELPEVKSWRSSYPTPYETFEFNP